MQAVLFIVAVILLVLAALPPVPHYRSLALLGAAAALLGYAWPVIVS